jgi:hypothetical protein
VSPQLGEPAQQERAAGADDGAPALLDVGLPGLVCTGARTAGHDRDVVGEMIAIAWAHIRAYPTHRFGHVAANVQLDVRKEYLHGLCDRHATARPVELLEGVAVGAVDTGRQSRTSYATESSSTS